MKNKKVIIMIATILVVLLITGLAGMKVVQASNIKKSIDLGNKYIADGSYEEAILEFEKAIEIDENNIDAKDSLDVLYAYKNIVTLITDKKFEEAKTEIENIKELPKYEIIKDEIEKAEDTLTEEEKKYEEELVMGKVNNIDGYWSQEFNGGTAFHRINIAENQKSYWIIDEMEITSGSISNKKYDKNTETISMDVEYKMMNGTVLNKQNERYRFIDDNTVKFSTDEGFETEYKKISYKELAYVSYGRGIYNVTESYQDISTASYTNAFYNGFINDVFIDKNKVKEVMDMEMVLSHGSHMALQSEKEAREVDILPNIRSYQVYNKNGGGATAPTIVFEDGESPYTCMEKYKKYAKK